MKTIMTTALAAMLGLGSANAQGFSPNAMLGLEEDNGLSFQLVGGMTVTNLRTHDIPWGNLNPKAGFTVGLRGEYLLPECYGVFVGAGVDYVMKGARDRVETLIGDIAGVGTDFVARSMYVSVPVHVGYRYDLLDALGLYADFGPYFSVGTNGRTRLQYDDYSGDHTQPFFNKEKSDIFYDIQRWDFGLGFRLGAEYAKHYNFVFACDWGITDMLTQSQKHAIVTNSNSAYRKPTMHNFAASLCFAYRF